MSERTANILERLDVLLADSRELLKKAKLGKPQAKMIGRNVRLAKRTMPLWLVLFLIFSSIGVTVFALTITALSVQKINIFGGQYQDTQFSITAIDTGFKGKNKISITLDVKNTDVDPHSCSVIVQLLDVSGDLITIGGVDMSLTQIIVDLAGGATQQFTLAFTGSGLVAVYSQAFVTVKQTA